MNHHKPPRRPNHHKLFCSELTNRRIKMAFWPHPRLLPRLLSPTQGRARVSRIDARVTSLHLSKPFILRTLPYPCVLFPFSTLPILYPARGVLFPTHPPYPYIFCTFHALPMYSLSISYSISYPSIFPTLPISFSLWKYPYDSSLSWPFDNNWTIYLI